MVDANRIKELREYFSGYYDGMVEEDRAAAKDDDPDGLVHPIYMSKLFGSYYRDVISALSELESARPLLEAVMKAKMCGCKKYGGDGQHLREQDEESILTAALAYRKEKEN
jgi:hypothetical protein